jgi:hypothetical protein
MTRSMPTKFAATLLAVFIFFSRADAKDFQTTKSCGTEGAIIPAETVKEWADSVRRGRSAPHGIQDMLGVDAESFWTPSPQDVELVETRLKAALEKAAKEPATFNEYARTADAHKYLSEQTGQILRHYSEYRRQYLGLIINGKRHIYINSFLSDAGVDYTHQLIVVFDGGFGFWRILYSVEDSHFHGLTINGEA